MPDILSLPNLPVDAAVLLVLLPDGATPPGTPPPAVSVALQALQRQLGAAIRILVINEASHPAVVHSFQVADLPSFVLVRQGVELWRQRGLPEGKRIVPQLLHKLQPDPQDPRSA